MPMEFGCFCAHISVHCSRLRATRGRRRSCLLIDTRRGIRGIILNASSQSRGQRRLFTCIFRISGSSWGSRPRRAQCGTFVSWFSRRRKRKNLQNVETRGNRILQVHRRTWPTSLRRSSCTRQTPRTLAMPARTSTLMRKSSIVQRIGPAAIGRDPQSSLAPQAPLRPHW